MRKLIAAVLLSALAVYAQATAVYPGRVATWQDLLAAKDNSASWLTADINSTVTAIPVAAGNLFIAFEQVTIETEQMLITSVSSNTLNVIRATNGVHASHTTNMPVRATNAARHHNQTAAEVMAIQTALGPNLSNIVVPGGTYNLSITGTAAGAPWAGITGKPSWIGTSAAAVADSLNPLNLITMNGTRPTIQFLGSTFHGRLATMNAPGLADMTSNLYYNGTDFVQDDPTIAGGMWRVNPTAGLRYWVYPPGYPGVAATLPWSMDLTGNSAQSGTSTATRFLGQLAYSYLDGLPAALSGMAGGRVRMAEVGCSSGYGSSCDPNNRGWPEYAYHSYDDKQFSLLWEDPNTALPTNTTHELWHAVKFSLTVNAVWCKSDTGDAVVNLYRTDSTTYTMLTTNLTCGSAWNGTTFTGAFNGFAWVPKPDYGIGLHYVSGTAKSIKVTFGGAPTY